MNFKRITVEDGLSQGSITTILQDKKGFLWIGTHDGLNRYDGVEFTVFRHRPGDSTTLSNNWITVLFEDNSGTVWVGTENGLNKFDSRTESFTTIHVQSSLTSPPPVLSTVLSIGEAEYAGDTLLWVGMPKLLLSNRDKSELQTPPSGLVAPIVESAVRWIQRDRDGDLWLGTNDGVFRMDRISRTLKSLMIPRPAGNAPVTSLLITSGRNASMLLGGKQGLFQIDLGNGQLHERDTGPIHSIMRDRRGRIWVSSNKGLGLLLDTLDGSVPVIYYRHDPRSLTSISNDYISAVYEDAAGSLWIGTLNGLNRLDTFTAGFSFLRHVPGDENTIGDNFVLSILEDRQGNVWFGSLGGGISVMRKGSPLGERFHHYRSTSGQSDGLISDNVRTLAEDREGNIWIGSAGGLQMYRPANGLFVSIPRIPASDTAGFWTHSLSPGRDGTMWAGTTCLVRIRRLGDRAPSTGSTRWKEVVTDRHLGLEFVKYRNPQDTGATYNVVFEARDQMIWIGTDHGLMRFDPVAESFVSYRHRTEDPTSISNDHVWCIAEDTTTLSDYLWIGTSQGLNKFNRRTGSSFAYYEQKGFPNAYIYSILIDDNKRLWISTNHGLTCFDEGREAGARFANYDMRDGLQGNEFNRLAHGRLRNGDFMFGGTHGVTVFHPELIESNPYVPPVVLSGITTMGKRAVFDRPVSELSALTLEYDDAVISFEFVALNFCAAEKNQYAYMMEGLERTWNYSGTRRSVHYARIDPGMYTFRVKASNNDGLWNETGVAIAITILPPFWETWWFRTLFAVLLAGTGFLVLMLRERRLRGLEQLRLRIARDLHDEIGGNLTGIAVAGSLLQESAPLTTHQERKANEITRTAVETSELLRDLVWIINPENDSLDDLTLRMKDFTLGVLSGRNVSFHIQQHSRPWHVHIDIKRNLYLAYKEIINNITKHSGADEIHVDMKMSGHDICLTVTDNGIGFDPAAASRGMGLHNIYERVRSVGGSVNISSGAEKGTRISIVLPIT